MPFYLFSFYAICSPERNQNAHKKGLKAPVGAFKPCAGPILLQSGANSGNSSVKNWASSA
jgi:hypothetical protein